MGRKTRNRLALLEYSENIPWQKEEWERVKLIMDDFRKNSNVDLNTRAGRRSAKEYLTDNIERKNLTSSDVNLYIKLLKEREAQLALAKYFSGIADLYERGLQEPLSESELYYLQKQLKDKKVQNYLRNNVATSSTISDDSTGLNYTPPEIKFKSARSIMEVPSANDLWDAYLKEFRPVESEIIGSEKWLPEVFITGPKIQRVSKSRTYKSNRDTTQTILPSDRRKLIEEALASEDYSKAYKYLTKADLANDFETIRRMAVYLMRDMNDINLPMRITSNMNKNRLSNITMIMDRDPLALYNSLTDSEIYDLQNSSYWRKNVVRIALLRELEKLKNGK